MGNADHSGVTARDGLVTFTGHVDISWQKRTAEKAGGRLKGVKAVADKITVRLPPEVKRDDEAVAAAVVDRLDGDGAVPPGAVKVEVTNGFVTLSGIVAHQYLRIAAGWAVQPQWGVTGVANQIDVTAVARKSANPDQISDEIRRALNRGWFTAETVHAPTAGAAPGTTSVENHIRIG